MKRKTVFLALLVLLLSVEMVFAGGGQQAGASGAGGGAGVTTQVTPKPLTVKPQYGDAEWFPEPATSYTTNPKYPQQPAISNANGFPIVQQKTTLRLATPSHSYVLDYYDNDSVRYMEELTGVTIEWDLLPEINPMERVNLMFAAGDGLPDAFFAAGLPSTLLATLGSGKLLIPLNDFIEPHMRNLKKHMEGDPTLFPAMHSADGNIYSLVDRSINEANQVSMRFWINQKFLDKLGMQMPTTTEEYYQYLVAVRDRDPNGNGIKDEIPLLGATTGWHAEIDGFLMNAFIYNETSDNRDPITRRRMSYDTTGKIDVSYNKPEWREGLAYLRRLCAEGLLSPDSFTITGPDRRSIVEREGVPLIGSLPSGGHHEFANTNGTRREDWKVMPPLKGPKGVQAAWWDEYVPVRVGRFAVTKDSKIPEVAMKWADYCLTPDWWTRNRYGVLGRDWVIPPAGTKSVRGGDATYEETGLRWGTPQKVYVGTNNMAFTFFSSYDRALSPDPFELEAVLWNARVAYWPYRFTRSVPRDLAFTVEESRDFVRLNTLIVEYVEQFLAQVVTGRIELNDTTWNKYVSDINSLGLPRLLTVTQSAFDRQWAEALGF